VELATEGFAADETLIVLSADSIGTASLPAGPCAGTATGLSESTLNLRATTVADASGTWSGFPTLPGAMCGSPIQVVGLTSCAMTGAVPTPTPPTVIDLSDADAKLIGENDYDYSGKSVSSAGDVNGDGFDDILVGAEFRDDGGRAYLVYGPVYGDVLLADADAVLIGADAGDVLGRSVSGAGDVNGDGFDDILVGAPGDDTAGTSAGAAFLLYGPLYGDIDPATAADAIFVGEEPSDNAGDTVSGRGDINGDGFDDILIGAESADHGLANGTVYVVYGHAYGTIDLSMADGALLGESGSNEAAKTISGAGDVNGDGFDDILVGASRPYSGTGESFVVHGPVYGAMSLSDAKANLLGESAMDDAFVVSGAGDVDGDGFDDVLIGAAGDDDGGLNGGCAYLLYGPVDGDVDLALADAKLLAEADGDGAGTAISDAGDVNGDGFADILVGAPWESTAANKTGATYLVYGPVSGHISLSDADVKIVGETRWDEAGSAVSNAGDVNGDGFDDLLVNAENSNIGGTMAGTTYVLYGPL